MNRFGPRENRLLTTFLLVFLCVGSKDGHFVLDQRTVKRLPG